MTAEERRIIREIQSVLLSVHDGRPVWFNVVRYQYRYKLVEPAEYDRGGMVKRWRLTEKGRQMINVII